MSIIGCPDYQLQRLQLIEMLVLVDQFGTVKTGTGGDEEIAGGDSKTFCTCTPGQFAGPIPNRFGGLQIANALAQFFQSRKFLRLRTRP